MIRRNRPVEVPAFQKGIHKSAQGIALGRTVPKPCDEPVIADLEAELAHPMDV